MSEALTHLAIGGSLTVLIVTTGNVDLDHPRRWVVAGALWGLVPDAGKLTPLPRMPAFHDSAWANLFWFHRTIDQLDPGDSVPLAIGTALVFLLILGIAERTGYRGWRRSDGDAADAPR